MSKSRQQRKRTGWGALKWGAIKQSLSPASFSDRRRLQWLMTVLATLLMLALGMWGYDEYDRSHGQPPHFSDNLYHSFALLRLKVDERHRPKDGAASHHALPWQLHVARILVPLVMFVFGILSLAVFLGVGVQRQVARRRRGHVVVSGDQEASETLVRALLDEGECVVVLRPEHEVHRGVITQLETLGATVIGGAATDAEALQRAGVHGARTLVSLDASDLVNLEVMLVAQAEVRGYRQDDPLLGIIGAHHFPFYQRLLDSDLAPLDGDDMRLRVYAVSAAMARAAILDLSWYRQWRVNAQPPGVFHAAVFGLSDVGLSLLTALARDPGIPGMTRRRITVFDPKASDPGDALDRLLTGLELPDIELPNSERADLERANSDRPTPTPLCEIQRVNFDPDHASPQLLIDTLGEAPPEVIYLCFDGDDRVFQCLLDLTRAMTASRLRRTHIKVRLAAKPALVRRWRSITGAAGSLLNIDFFGDKEHCYHPDEVLREAADETARAIHQTYAATFGGASDASRRPWESLPEPFRDANRQQADSLCIKLAVLGCVAFDGDAATTQPPIFTPDGDELEQLSMAEHQRWSSERMSKGWRFGQQRDDARRLHPSLIPYAQLSDLEQEKDRNAVRNLFRTAQAGERHFVRQQTLCILTAAGEQADGLLTFIERRRDPRRPMVLITSLLSSAEQQAAAIAVADYNAVIERVVPDCCQAATARGKTPSDAIGIGCRQAIDTIAEWPIGQPDLLQRVEQILYLPVTTTIPALPDAEGCFHAEVVAQMREVLSRTLDCVCWSPHPEPSRENENH